MSSADSAKPTVEDSVNSLTGFDEIAVRKRFGAELSDLSATMMMRALVYILNLRESKDEPAAFNAAMKMPLGDIQNVFADGEVVEGEA